ncbi:hypothetical protein Poli38472_007343 [Pythium oligandrum]|uniref:Uncharacterized protein n=1 Tax=Pythium oligandrum TaxID=41045 RepID=A0A8K1CAM3_PYTOL|nr:hypothetical protein Poli38472_007343 [Pythium oligandrum]|eukprot:TMW59198.1 hypothetical protein Poli38472_007343 [Pythium oligandrum]
MATHVMFMLPIPQRRAPTEYDDRHSVLPGASIVGEEEVASLGVVDTLNALTSYFLPEIAEEIGAATGALIPEATESLLLYSVDDQLEDEEEQDEPSLPDTIVPLYLFEEEMTRERSGSNTSVSSVNSQTSVLAATATSFSTAATTALSSWFSYDEPVSHDQDEQEDAVLTDADADVTDDEDFLLEDLPVTKPHRSASLPAVDASFPTDPRKARSASSATEILQQPWSALKSFTWGWPREQ